MFVGLSTYIFIIFGLKLSYQFKTNKRLFFGNIAVVLGLFLFKQDNRVDIFSHNMGLISGVIIYNF